MFSLHDRSSLPVALSAPLTGLLATGAGLAVASLYYSQPMLGVLADDTGTSAAAVGWLPTLTQLGYALGILFLAPLGDRCDRRTIIVAKALVLSAALLLAGLAPTLAVLLAASLVIGLSATLAQDIVPAAATLAPAAHRGRVVGTVMTGLLLGILLSRVVSGFVAEQAGWRWMFGGAAVAVAGLAVATWRGLPRFAPTTRLAYGDLLRSLGALWARHPALRRAALAQGVLAIGFSAFWSTLAVLLHGAPYHLGAATAGAFGLAGAAGAFGAPITGRLADRQGPDRVARLGAGLVLLSFAAMVALPWLDTTARIVLLVVVAVGFDLGFQATLIAHQTIVYGLEPEARSRLNALLFVTMFIGMALGAASGSLAMAQFGWGGVPALAVVAAAIACALRRHVTPTD